MTKHTCSDSGESFTLERKEVAQLLNTDIFVVLLMEDRKAIPRPVRLGPCVRYTRVKIEEWIDAGCPALAV